MLPGAGRDHPATRGALQQTLLDQVGFDHVLDGVADLADGGRDVVQSHRTATEALDDGFEEIAVHDVQPDRVHVEHAQGVVGHAAGDAAVGADLGVVPHPAEQSVGNARRAARAAGDLVGAVFGDVGAQQAGRAQNDALQLVGLVELARQCRSDHAAGW